MVPSRAGSCPRSIDKSRFEDSKNPKIGNLKSPQNLVILTPEEELAILGSWSACKTISLCVHLAIDIFGEHLTLSDSD